MLRLGIGLPVDQAAGLAARVHAFRPAIDIHLRQPAHATRRDHRALGNARIFIFQFSGLQHILQIGFLAMKAVDQTHRRRHHDTLLHQMRGHIIAPLPDEFQKRLCLVWPIAAKLLVQLLDQFFDVRNLGRAATPYSIQIRRHRNMPDQRHSGLGGNLAQLVIILPAQITAGFHRVIACRLKVCDRLLYFFPVTNNGFALCPADHHALKADKGRKLGRDDENLRPDPALFDLALPGQIVRLAVHLAHLCHAIGDIEQQIIGAFPQMDMRVGKARHQIHALTVYGANALRHLPCPDRADQAILDNHGLGRNETVRLRRQHIHIDQRIGLCRLGLKLRLGHLNKGAIHSVQFAVDEQIARHRPQYRNHPHGQQAPDYPFHHDRLAYLVTV